MVRLPRVLLAAALVALATVAPAPTRAAEPDKFLPADADTVAVVNLKQLVGSDVFKKNFLEKIQSGLEDEKTKKLLTDLGLDPLKDIEKIVVASIDTQFKQNENPSFVIVVRGTFDPEKLFKRAELEAKTNPDQFALIRDGGAIMFKVTPEGQQPMYATVVDEKAVIAASEKKYITAALKVADGGKPAALKKEIADLIKKADDKASVYVASLLKGKLDELKPGQWKVPIKLEAFDKTLPDAESLLVGINIGTDVSLNLTVGMKDGEAATDMQNAVEDLLQQARGLLQLAAIADGQAKQLLDVLGGVKTTVKNKDVNITIKVSGADVGALTGPRRKKDPDKK